MGVCSCSGLAPAAPSRIEFSPPTEKAFCFRLAFARTENGKSYKVREETTGTPVFEFIQLQENNVLNISATLV